MTRAERISFAIQEKGLSYQELSKITGLSKSSLQRYASGTTTKIPLDAIELIADACGVSQEFLMGWDEDKKEKPAEGGELSPKQKAFIDRVMQMSDVELERLDQILRIVEGTNK